MAKNSTQPNKNGNKFDARRSIRALQKRVGELERIVAEIQIVAQGSLDTLPKQEPKKRGPKPRKGLMIQTDRDRLVEMLESYWPEIEPLCSPQPNATKLKRVFVAVDKQMHKRFGFHANSLVANMPVLVKFLSSDRFRSDPRQIANALAGVPDVSFWTSLKTCQAQPCNAPIGERAMRAYLRRKHPELYGRLMADESLVNFATALRDHPSLDAKLQQFTGQSLYLAWKKCSADYASLGLGPMKFAK